MKLIQTIHTVSFLLCITSLLVAGLGFFFFLQPEIPLWYSLYRAEDQMTSKAFIFTIPALMFGIYGTSNIFRTLLKDDHESVRHLIAFGSFCCILMFFITLIRIMVIAG
ncbi:MAG: hypothetical protein HZA34_02410 [Candidatus Pacebacteria bacterium]|nr:hypothetical protein [Candidatus Paceibacterota bacterium]